MYNKMNLSVLRCPDFLKIIHVTKMIISIYLNNKA